MRLLDIDNSGWCNSLSTFDSENVIKKGNTKQEPDVRVIQASAQRLCQRWGNTARAPRRRLRAVKDQQQQQGTALL